MGLVTKEIDVIIVNFNSTDHLLNCIKSILSADTGLIIRIIVVDNGSSDCVTRIASLDPTIKLVLNKKNRGFARGVNQGLQISRSPYCVVLNPDTKLSPHFFKPAIEYLEQNPDVGILGPKILNGDGTLQGSARTFPTPLTGLFGRTSLLSKLFPGNRITRYNMITMGYDKQEPISVDWVSGACMFIRREAYEQVGGLDENFFMYWEDADWCKRMHRTKWNVVYFPQSIVTHFVGASSSTNPIRSIYEFHQSVYRLFSKYARFPINLFKPFAFFGLMLRFFVVIFINLIGRFIKLNAEDFGTKFESKKKIKGSAIKILRVISRLNIGGPAIHVNLLTKGMDPQKFNSLLVTGRISEKEGDMSYLFTGIKAQMFAIPELQREIRFGLDIIATWRIFTIIRRYKPDIIHTHTSKAGISARIAAFLYSIFFPKDIKIVHTFHGNVFEGYFGKTKTLLFLFIERLVSKFTNTIIAISQTQKIELVQKYAIAPQSKVKVIPLGFNLSPFLENQSKKGMFRKQFGISEGTILIGIIGRLVPIKNHYLFFDAIKKLLQNNLQLDVRFMVIGDGELRNDLESYCEKLELNAYITFCGWMKDVFSVYADLDILTLTSINEGTPVSIIEAMASSVSVIATPAGGVVDLLGSKNGEFAQDGFWLCERGLLCQHNDSWGLANALRYSISQVVEKQVDHVISARNYVQTHYSQTRLFNDLETLYLSLLDEKNK